MSVHQHKKQRMTLNCAIITISDTRTKETDKSGNSMSVKLQAEGHTIVSHDIIEDDQDALLQLIEENILHHKADAILTNGGTGISYRDVTYETVKSLLDKELNGFGELFRKLSYEEDIGSAAIMSRAIAGVYKNTAIFSTPGSSGAVKLAMDRLIVPEIQHIVYEIKKDLS